MSKFSIIINSFSTLIVRGTTLGIRVLAFILLAKIADQNIFGMLAFLMACTEIFRIIADMGLDNYTIKNISQSKNDRDIDRILSTAAIQKMVSALLIFILYFSIFKFSNPEWSSLYISLFGLMAVSPMFLNFSVNYYLATQKLEKILPTIIIMTLIIITVFMFFWFQKEVLLALTSVVVGEFTTASILSWKIVRRHEIFWVSFKKIFKNLKSHYAIGIAMLVAILYSRLDIIFIKYFFANLNMAMYGFAQRITEPALFIVGAFSANSYSLLSRYYLDGMALFSSRIKKVVVMFFCIGAFIVICTAITAWYIVSNYYLNYIAILPVIYMLCAAIIFKSINLSLTSTILAMGDFKIMTYVSFINLLLSVIFIYSFLYYFGLYGAALGVIVVESINSMIQGVYVYMRLRYKKNVH
ncbi:MAG: oligosaccharide flippase family protein [Providencia sp.]|uniref:oligosaccharide flippase family protein n=1 Tax=Providencia sp. TaxID=589 RepID=UPI003F9827B1